MSHPEASGGNCTQPGCPVAETGECLNGLPPAKCPHYSQEPATAEHGSAESTISGTAPAGDLPDDQPMNKKKSSGHSEGVELPRGEALIPREVVNIRAESLPRLVVIAGPPKAGKTTLVTSIFEALQCGGFGGHLFSASATLPGLEQRCFLNRPESGLDFPDTEHTRSSAEPRFLHLRTAKEEPPGTHVDVLFGDISGEDYEDIRNNSGVIERMAYLSMADHLAIVVDGETLCHPGERDTTDMISSPLMERFVASAEVSHDCQVHVVISKMDLVEHNGGEDALAFASDLSERLKKSAERRFEHVVKHFVAARPTGDEPSNGRKLDMLYRSWAAYCRPLPAQEGD